MTMIKLCLALIFAGLRPNLWAAETGDSCAACHRTMEGVGYLEHNFNDWEKSVHAKAGVGCSACHGGNPQAKDKSTAHAGLKRSTDSGSPVYFTNIPATCGTCHQPELKAFQKSVHYRELERSGRGPNCVSCHGSMANHVLAPRDLELTCTLCHQRPTQASATMIALGNAGTALKRLEKALGEARDKRLEVAPQERDYQGLRDLHRRAQKDWHTFHMAPVLQTAHEIARRSTTALNEIHLKEQQQKP